MAEQLALVAGVQADAVLVDRDNRRAVVTAQPLAGADLGAYRLLEGRVAAAANGWSIELVPPAVTPRPITFGDDGPDAAGQASLQTVIWAARRLRLPLGVSGGQAPAVIAALAEAGVTAERQPGNGTVTLSWLAPRVAAEPTP